VELYDYLFASYFYLFYNNIVLKDVVSLYQHYSR